MPPSPRMIDLRGQRFSRLVAIDISQHQSKGDTKWICLCDCGNRAEIRAQNLKRGVAKSCGCLKREKSTTHGLSKTQEHRIWRGLFDRCYNPNKPKIYARYGGRGIVVSDEWHNFANFYRDMGKRPNNGMTVERVDNNGPYAGWNCKWATRVAQGRNRRDNRLIPFEGKSLTLGEIMENCESAVPYTVVNARINDGWSLNDALSYPKSKHRPRHTRVPKSVVGSR